MEKLVSRRDMELAWGLSPAKVKSLTAESDFPAPRWFGRSIRWVEQEVEAWSAARESTPPRPRAKHVRPDAQPIQFRMTPRDRG
ncbi:MAG: AlpA family phage regulatory protein [Actinobacteria bacterium]|nr:AlpA family phage regulatory protein [Actinomycetota bacterium]